MNTQLITSENCDTKYSSVDSELILTGEIFDQSLTFCWMKNLLVTLMGVQIL